MLAVALFICELEFRVGEGCGERHGGGGLGTALKDCVLVA